MWRKWFMRPKGPGEELLLVALEAHELAEAIREETACYIARAPSPQRRDRVG